MKPRLKQRSFSKGALSNVLPFDVLNGRSAIIALLALSGLLLFSSIINPSFMQGARTGLVDITAPVLKAINTPFDMAANFVGGVSGLTNLRAENAQLEAENKRLREWYQTALMLQAENQSLQELLNVKVDAPHKYITAKVIADSGNSFVKTVLVGVGQIDGVQKNQAVLGEEGLIGRVIEVGKTSSRIMLLTDLNSRVPIILEGTRQKAMLTGSNAPLLDLKYIPDDSAITTGIRVVTSGDGGVFPSGLPIGRVSSIENKSIKVKPFADINHVSNVRIVNTSINPNLMSIDLDTFKDIH